MGIEAILASGGRLVLMEFHPLLKLFDERMNLVSPYFSDGQPISYGGVGDYVADSGEGLAPGGLREGVRDFRNRCSLAPEHEEFEEKSGTPLVREVGLP